MRLQENQAAFIYTNFTPEEFDGFMQDCTVNDAYKKIKKVRQTVTYLHPDGTEMLVQHQKFYGGRVIIWKRFRKEKAAKFFGNQQ